MAANIVLLKKAEKISWSNDQETYLIDLIYPQRCLWDIANPLYSKKTFKYNVMCKISEEMCRRWPSSSSLFTYENIGKKFTNLRTYFHKELKKIEALKSGSGCESLSPRWPHFSRLLFLQDSVTPLPSSSNLNESFASENLSEPQIYEAGGYEVDVSDSTVGGGEPFFIEERIESSTPEQQYQLVTDIPAVEEAGPSQPAPKKRRKISPGVDDPVEMATKYLKELMDKPAEVSEAHGDMYFGNYVTTQLARFSNEKKKDLCKLDIMKCLIKHLHDTE